MVSSCVGQKGDIEVDPRVVKEQARQTVRQLVDAVVELVTNSDDSYIREESIKGEISIVIRRLKGGRWDLLEVRDHAQGMDLETLIDALKYGTKHSGFAEGKHVRGLWGRGLKETIISFGEGIITSIHDGQLSSVKVWWDHDANKGRWEVVRSESTSEENGTGVAVSPEAERGGKCPEPENMYEQLCNHYALRTIVQDRDVRLHMKSLGGRGSSTKTRRKEKYLKFKVPAGDLVLDKPFKETAFGPTHIRIWQSATPLSFERWDPSCSVAGLIIKSNGIPFDNSLFGYEDEEGKYFFGEVDCPQLANKIKEDASLLTTTRTGIDWRQSLSRDFYGFMKLILQPLVNNKKAEFAGKSAPQISGRQKNRLLRMLNQLAQEELETATDEGGVGPGGSPQEVTKLVVKPDFGYALPDTDRRFSVYLPKSLANKNTTMEVALLEPTGTITLSDTKIALAEHPSRENLLWGQFAVRGLSLGDNTWIRCFADSQEDMSYFAVKIPDDEPGKGQKKKLVSKGGGFFKDIKPNADPHPSQRVAYINGAINWFTEYPVIKEYVVQKRFGTDEGKVLFAEMMTEAVCTILARNRIADGLVPGRPNEDPRATIDRYNAESNRIKGKCTALLHRWAKTYNVETQKGTAKSR